MSKPLFKLVNYYYTASSRSGQDESNPALWLATRAGKMELSCPFGTTRCVLQETFPRKPYNKSFTDQACSVKMAGYWPCPFFVCVKNLANIQPPSLRTCSRSWCWEVDGEIWYCSALIKEHQGDHFNFFFQIDVLPNLDRSWSAKRVLDLRILFHAIIFNRRVNGRH